MDGFKVFEMFPQSEEENVKYGVLIAHVPPRKKLGAVKQERGEKFQFKGRLLKVCPWMKLRDNRRFRVFLQIHFKLVYHMIFFDLETEGSLRRGEEVWKRQKEGVVEGGNGSLKKQPLTTVICLIFSN